MGGAQPLAPRHIIQASAVDMHCFGAAGLGLQAAGPSSGGCKHGFATTGTGKANETGKAGRARLTDTEIGAIWCRLPLCCLCRPWPGAQRVRPVQQAEGTCNWALAPRSHTAVLCTAQQVLHCLTFPHHTQVSHLSLLTAQLVCHLFYSSPTAQQASLFAPPTRQVRVFQPVQCKTQQAALLPNNPSPQQR